jgi:hypothetical protein
MVKSMPKSPLAPPVQVYVVFVGSNINLIEPIATQGMAGFGQREMSSERNRCLASSSVGP